MDGDLSDFEEKKKFLKRVQRHKRPPPQKKKTDKKNLLKNFLKKLVRMFANKLGTELSHTQFEHYWGENILMKQSVEIKINLIFYIHAS